MDLTLAQWAADGLLAIFFFVAGDLRDPRRAALPVAAAVGGMAGPALIYLAFNAGSGNGALAGWAIPTATDIAFAPAVLAVMGTHLPAALRTFLLTLAVVDDLLAITIIAVFYTSSLQPLPLALALIPLGVFALLVQRRVRSWWVLLPLAAVTWHFEHRFRPISAGVAVPEFAFFAAGVSIAGAGGLGASLGDSVTLGSSPPSWWANSSVWWARRGSCSGSPAPSSPPD